MSQAFPRLSEQDLAQLYVQTHAPLRLDALLQGQEKADAAQIAVHDSMSGQTPDLALISLSLCGLIVARDFPLELKDGPYGPVLRELIVCAEDNLFTVGRLWLDCNYGITPDPKIDRETVTSIPDRLRILTSIFMELRDALQESGHMYWATKTLYYQAESHSDLAEKFVGSLEKLAKKTPPQRPIPDHVPLPYELNRPKTGAEIVAFSLFRERRLNS